MAKEKGEEGLLKKAAKAIGHAAGSVAASVGVVKDEAPAKKAGAGKLQKKNKSRLPRKQKKEMKKKQAAIRA